MQQYFKKMDSCNVSMQQRPCRWCNNVSMQRVDVKTMLHRHHLQTNKYICCTLQRTATTHCRHTATLSTNQCVFSVKHSSRTLSVRSVSAVCLQCVCSVSAVCLQCVCSCNTLDQHDQKDRKPQDRCNIIFKVIPRCNNNFRGTNSVMQFVAVCCSVLQCVAVCCRVLQCHLKLLMNSAVQCVTLCCRSAAL